MQAKCAWHLAQEYNPRHIQLILSLQSGHFIYTHTAGRGADVHPSPNEFVRADQAHQSDRGRCQTQPNLNGKKQK